MTNTTKIIYHGAKLININTIKAHFFAHVLNIFCEFCSFLTFGLYYFYFIIRFLPQQHGFPLGLE